MSITNQLGDAAELAVAAEILRLGYKVAIPFGHDWKYDLIVEIEGELKKVQVKSTEPKNGKLTYKVGTNTNILKGKHQFHTYTKVDIDYFIGYDRVNKNCYLIPMELVESVYDTVTIRLKPTKNKNYKKIHWAKDYLLEKL